MSNKSMEAWKHGSGELKMKNEMQNVT